ncbi:MAG: hypothetical protein KatS3mg057_1171 [Herpetosiphonaceae bacterium]|nr:MAG: hypothetical protein KatS3mg057_1171 [Herpetosiphonaceae bacterium]
MAPRLLLLDRDGTLNRTLGRRPPNRPDELQLLPGVRETLQRYLAEGWLPVLITNQAGVAFGYIDEEQLQLLHRRLEELLAYVLPPSIPASNTPTPGWPTTAATRHVASPGPA